MCRFTLFAASLLAAAPAWADKSADAALAKAISAELLEGECVVAVTQDGEAEHIWTNRDFIWETVFVPCETLPEWTCYLNEDCWEAVCNNKDDDCNRMDRFDVWVGKERFVVITILDQDMTT